MKKIIIIIGLFLLVSCNASATNMNLVPRQLQENESNILDLLPNGFDVLIYDYQVSDAIKSLRLNTYQLSEGDWELISKSMQPVDEPSGRLSIVFNEKRKGVSFSLNDSETIVTSSQDFEDSYASNNMKHLEEEKVIESNKEFPVFIDIKTNQNNITYFDLEFSFENPDQLQNQGADSVYLMTLLFSDKEINQLATE